jgi:hypothetical protein
MSLDIGFTGLDREKQVRNLTTVCDYLNMGEGENQVKVWFLSF